MSLTAEITHLLRILEADAFSTAGRTTTHRVETQKIIGATRHDAKVYTLSAGLSQVALDVSPIVASLPGSLLWLTANAPVGLRLNDASGLFLSAVYQMMLAMSTISSLFLTPPVSADATVHIELVGGGTVTYSTPLP
jgi:hypothetical protein